MAQEPDLMSREIEEELRRERLLKLWDTYGLYVVAAVVALVLAAAGWQYYGHRQAQAREAASAGYIEALVLFGGNRPYDAQKRLEDLIASNAPGGYATLARLRLAAFDVGEGYVAEALDAYDKLARDKSVDPVFADFARLQIATLNLDKVAFTEVRNQLTPLAGDKNPWRYSARELLGLGAAKAGNLLEAKRHFKRLLDDPTAPPGVASRARVMMLVLAERERAAVPPATEKSETPAKVEPGQGTESESKGGPGNGKKGK
jgi:hypothetical protein